DYNNRYKLYEFMLKKENLDGDINYIEFGVAQGHSFKWWMQNNKNPQAHFYGFDTFTGLPEDWNFLFKKGSMSDSGKIPEVVDSRGELFPGLFQDTLPGFLSKLDNTKRNIIHLDADLYTSTLYVLTTMAPFIKKNDILMFDEFFVPTHEFKAFTEFVSAFYLKYEVIGAINNFLQTAIKITDK
ncbi:MAG: class I SAM-dependent methyltransferase, partial [Syntrophothermus sp.]